MAIQRIRNVRIAGVSAAVPSHIIKTHEWDSFSSEEERNKFITHVGIEEVRRHKGDMTCSDLCQKSAEKLIQELGWETKDVDLLIYGTLLRDYIEPPTACVLHGKMGLSQDCAVMDIPHGCSGWVYGISVAAGLMQNGAFKRALILTGDAEPMGPSHPTRSDHPLFGDAGTATALVYDESAPEMLIETKTDGSGYEAIIRRSGGDRYPVDEQALKYAPDIHGRIHRAVDNEMDGAAVFVFGISQVPRSVKNMLQLAERNVDNTDYFLMHQANRMMNEQIRRKCGIPPEKHPYSLPHFGNTGAGSIPLTMVACIRDQLADCSEKNLLACGFGVGLSWATLYTQTHNLIIPPLIEL